LPILKRTGLIDLADVDTVASYCQACAEFQLAAEALDEDGRYIKSKRSGLVSKHPALQQQQVALKQIELFGNLLGLSPKARKILNIPTGSSAESKDELDTFLDDK